MGGLFARLAPSGRLGARKSRAAGVGLVALDIDGAIVSPARAVDGDTLRLPDGRYIRLWGIDAPERQSDAGEQARLSLHQLTQGHLIRCVLPPTGQDRDRYGRLVRQCFVGQHDIADDMVASGHAHDWPRYSGGFYAR